MRTHTLDGNEPSNKEIREHFERLSATRFRVERQMVAMLLDRQTAMRDALRELSEAVKPTREGKRDGGTFGRLSMADDNARAILATVEGEQ